MRLVARVRRRRPRAALPRELESALGARASALRPAADPDRRAAPGCAASSAALASRASAPTRRRSDGPPDTSSYASRGRVGARSAASTASATTARASRSVSARVQRALGERPRRAGRRASSAIALRAAPRRVGTHTLAGCIGEQAIVRSARLARVRRSILDRREIGEVVVRRARDTSRAAIGSVGAPRRSCTALVERDGLRERRARRRRSDCARRRRRRRCSAGVATRLASSRSRARAPGSAERIG